LDKLIEHWLICHERFERDKRHIGRLLTLKYENFVEEPQRALRMIYSFLGLPTHLNSIEVRPNINEQYLQRWRAGQDDALSGGRIDTDRIKSRYERRVAAFGYSLDV
jgi:hypothetical protein